MWFCQAEHRHTQFATKSHLEKAARLCTNKSGFPPILVLGRSFTPYVTQSPTTTWNGHTARNAAKRLPLRSGSSIKWETYLHIFSLEESVITRRVRKGCRFSENYMLAWFSIIAYSQPSVVHRRMKLRAGRTKGGRIPRSAVVL